MNTTERDNTNGDASGPPKRTATILKLACPDAVGLLARITGFIASHGGNLLEVHQFTDPVSGWFFARLSVDSKTLNVPPTDLGLAFAQVAADLKAEWSIRESSERPRVGIMVSRQGHCLADLLWRWNSGELAIDIPLVISNHEVLRDVVEREKIRFEYIPIPPHDKARAFDQIRETLAAAAVETIILARYMQILPRALCSEWHGRLINIHHSFLPSFVGANPYQRAHQRGVKLIGATCHYATADLDEGPIIDQEVVRVEHYHSPEDLLRLGRDCERLALARGVRYHINDRVLIHENRSIVFRD